MVNRAAFFGAPQIEWRELDLSILDDRRSATPAVPLELVPQPWRTWIADTALATGSPQDYVLQAVLAGVAGVCGAGMRVQVTASWSEPMVLWQAIIGEASTGKSAALAPMRRLLDVIEQERRRGDDDRREAEAERNGRSQPFVPSRIVMSTVDPEAVAETIAGNPRGVLLWRDAQNVWLGGAGDDAGEGGLWLEGWGAGAVIVDGKRQRDLASFPVSIVETMRPDRLKAVLLDGAESQAARFLYAWPSPQPYRNLAALESVDDTAVLEQLRRVSHLARTPNDPCELRFDAHGLAALDAVLADLHRARASADGLEAAWLGKGKAFIARLAGAIELLGFAGGPRSRPGAIGRAHVEAASALWRSYYWPHARAVFDSAELSDHKRRVRRVARWLHGTRLTTVSRHDIRRVALSQAATAEETEQVLQRLHYLGYVQPDPAYRDKSGRPSSHWQINPALCQKTKAGSETSEIEKTR